MIHISITRRQVGQNLIAAVSLLLGAVLALGLAYVCTLSTLAAAGFQLEGDALEKLLDRMHPATLVPLTLASFGLAALTLSRLERAARRLGAEVP
jgi:hypothetical protein